MLLCNSEHSIYHITGGKKKDAVIAKSSLLLDVKPWDDETPMEKLEECVRSIEMEGLLWGACKFLSFFDLNYIESLLFSSLSSI